MSTQPDPLSTYTHLPLTLDPSSKSLSSTLPHLTTPLSHLSTLQRTLLSLPTQTPPAPSTTNPKRSAQIAKMRDQGNTSLRKASSTTTSSSSSSTTTSSTTHIQEAIQLYTYSLEMALSRPPWEPCSLVREECSLLYSNRAQAYMASQMWAEAAADAECSVECKRVGNSKAWWRRGKSLCEMGRWGEAGKWVEKGLEVVGEGEKEGGKEREELVGLGREIERWLEGERGGGR
ncbi:MAG: hypothetical protein Q9169_008150 [Polycauliona sp. 2 TL-2023]